MSKRIQEGGVAAARRSLAEDVLQRLFGRQVLSLLTSSKIEALIEAVAATFRQERIQRGLLRLRCHEGEALARTLDVLQLNAQIMSESFFVVTNRFEGPSDAGRVAAAAFTDTLQSYRFRAAGRAQGAPLVVSISGRLAFTSMPRGTVHAQLYRGQLRCQAVRVRVYHRPSDQILHHSAIVSNKEIRKGERQTSQLYQPWIGRDASIAEAGEPYANAVGQMAGQRVARALLVRILRARGHATATTRAFRPEAESACEEAPLAAHQPEVAAERVAPRAPRYVLRFKGLDDAEVDEAIEDLQENSRFARWKHVGTTGDVHVYACDYSGRGVVLRLREALVESDVRVTKRGPRLTIRPR
ncbi:MAG: hypothetical protein JKY65_21495 [Planctomycetes bacterium]|nr:hypothetical protein [Planctomycetota bacterium]